jgi:hypothetical protein
LIEAALSGDAIAKIDQGAAPFAGDNDASATSEGLFQTAHSYRTILMHKLTLVESRRMKKASSDKRMIVVGSSIADASPDLRSRRHD